jgi:hypothetical protein
MRRTREKKRIAQFSREVNKREETENETKSNRYGLGSRNVECQMSTVGRPG